jgi:hypothetical protein
MTSQGNGRQPLEYAVEMSEKTKATLKQRQQEASEAGTGEAFLSALRLIGERLRKDPLTFGEPLYRLPALKLLVCQGVVPPLLVDYAVHEELPVVFIREVRSLS